MRGILDGHIMLSRRIAAKGRFPAVDIGLSNSRLWEGLVSAGEYTLITKIKRILAEKTEIEEMIEIGSFKAGGTDTKQDNVLRVGQEVERIFIQRANEQCIREKTYQELERAVESLDAKV